MSERYCDNYCLNNEDTIDSWSFCVGCEKYYLKNTGELFHLAAKGHIKRSEKRRLVETNDTLSKLTHEMILQRSEDAATINQLNKDLDQLDNEWDVRWDAHCARHNKTEAKLRERVVELEKKT